MLLDVGTGYGVGGICGQGLSNGSGSFGNVEKCVNYGRVVSSFAAGIVHRGYGNIDNCINYGKINGGCRSAGIQISIPSNSTISNCYNFGEITTNSYISVYGTPYGGIGCDNSGTIVNSYNVGKCYLQNKFKSYDIFYTNTGVVENSYYLNQALDDGKILTEEFMKSDEFINMLGGEYKKDNLGRNKGYPMLKWQK